jgi:replicative DNA helicase
MDNTVVGATKAAARAAEQALLGSVMLGGRAVYEKVSTIVKEEDFYDDVHKIIWGAIVSVYEQGLCIDSITIGDELERNGEIDKLASGSWSGRAVLSAMIENGKPRAAEHYASLVVDYSLKRRLLAFANQLAGWSLNGRKAADIIKDMYEELSKMTPPGAGDEHTADLAEALSEAYDATERASRDEEIGIASGLIDFDRLIGSFLPSNLYIVAARPGQGKSALLLTIARNAVKSGKRVLLFSLEMSKAQLAQRLLAQEAQIDLFKIMRGKMEEKEWERYHQAIERLEAYKDKFIFNDMSGLTITEVRNIARRAAAKYGKIDAVFFDYIQLAGNDEDVYTREQEVAAVSRGLQRLAREMDIPVIAAAQLSRAVEQRADKRPVLSDLRESGALEQDAYAVIFIYRKDEDVQTELLVSKHRNGKTGIVKVVWRPQFTEFVSAAIDKI